MIEGRVRTEALMDRARDVSRAFCEKLQARDPELAKEFVMIMKAHAAVVAALFGGEVSNLRRE